MAAAENLNPPESEGHPTIQTSHFIPVTADRVGSYSYLLWLFRCALKTWCLTLIHFICANSIMDRCCTVSYVLFEQLYPVLLNGSLLYCRRRWVSEGRGERGWVFESALWSLPELLFWSKDRKVLWTGITWSQLEPKIINQIESGWMASGFISWAYWSVLNSQFRKKSLSVYPFVCGS